MLTYVVGNLFQSPAHVLVNTVNTVGVMGKGIAKTFKIVYPEMFKRYQHLCETKKLTIGRLWLYKTSNKLILNFPTKTTWREPSRVEYIEKGLKAFVKGYAEQGITSIAFPALGCGNGELNWEKQVRPLMEKYLKPLPIDIFFYVYKKGKNIPEHKNIKAISQWLRSEPESLGFEEVWTDLEKLIGSGIQLRSFYKNKPFRINLLQEEKGLLTTIKERNEYIFYDELISFWNTLRSYGFAFPAVMPPGAAPYEDFLLALFAKLSYCREIIVTKRYRALDEEQARGIQFIPHSSKSSFPLFKRPQPVAAL
jgi:O-acetyl-ADP-ribose deacetylase (regulator of RNase III)